LLSESYGKTELLKRKLESRTRAVLVLGLIFAASLAYKILALVLRLKGVRLPWILDLIG
jgi:hypothetical protein